MDLGLEGVTAAEPLAKRVAVGPKSEDPELKKLIALIAKLVMNLEWQCRCFKAILIVCYRVSKEMDYVVKPKEAAGKLFKRSQELKEEGMSNVAVKARLGPSHIQAFNAAIGFF